MTLQVQGPLVSMWWQLVPGFPRGPQLLLLNQVCVQLLHHGFGD